MERLFTWRSGGWVLAAAIVLTLAGTLWNLAPLFDPQRKRPRGDGRTAGSYGFDLSGSLVPREQIVSSGMVADALPALIDPKTISPAGPSRYLVPTDRVIGIVANGSARAYPLRVLNWHEVVNDTVGGVPILVTYHPLSGAIAVFDRRIGDRTRTFGVSGLLYQSNLLMYERAGSAGGESLWSQLQARAVTGSSAEAGETLELFPFALATCGDWLRAHPETTILAPVPGEEKKYDQDVYGTYLNSRELRFPVDPLPPEDPSEWKRTVFVSGSPERWVVTRPGTTPETGFYAFWFAWYATHAGAAR